MAYGAAMGGGERRALKQTLTSHPNKNIFEKVYTNRKKLHKNSITKLKSQIIVKCEAHNTKGTR